MLLKFPDNLIKSSLNNKSLSSLLNLKCISQILQDTDILT
jgi:hypothetical protein